MSVGAFLTRAATQEDIGGISACINAAYEHYIARIGKPPGPMLDDYAEVVRKHTVFVIESDPSAAHHNDEPDNGEPDNGELTDFNSGSANSQGIMGVLVLIEVEPEKRLGGFRLDNVALHPAVQGKGLGRQLMALAEEVATERGHETIHLYTHERMTENLSIYQRSGYEEVERRSEKGFTRVYLQKRLT